MTENLQYPLEKEKCPCVLFCLSRFLTNWRNVLTLSRYFATKKFCKVDFISSVFQTLIFRLEFESLISIMYCWGYESSKMGTFFSVSIILQIHFLAKPKGSCRNESEWMFISISIRLKMMKITEKLDAHLGTFMIIWESRKPSLASKLWAANNNGIFCRGWNEKDGRICGTHLYNKENHTKVFLNS